MSESQFQFYIYYILYIWIGIYQICSCCYCSIDTLLSSSDFLETYPSQRVSMDKLVDSNIFRLNICIQNPPSE